MSLRQNKRAQSIVPNETIEWIIYITIFIIAAIAIRHILLKVIW